jgi:hypothetical protein
MHTSSGRIAFLLVLSLAGASREAPAQWALTAEIGAARFWGASAEIGGGGLSFRPYRPTIFGLGIERQRGRLGLGVRLQYAGASLALEGKDALAAVKGALDIYGFSPELSVVAKRFPSAVQLRLSGGPLVELWDVGTGASHTRVGAQAGLGLHVPVSGRIIAGLRLNGAVTPSPFTTGDLAAGYEPRTLWRRAMSVSLHYRL